MADTKGSALAEMTIPVATDLIVAVDDPAGTPETQKVTFGDAWANYFKGQADALYAALSHNHAASAITSGTFGTSLIADDAITFPKLLNATQVALIGAGAAGPFQEVTLGSGFSIDAGVLNFASGGTDGAAIHDNVAGEINALAAKTTLHENDEFIVEDFEASYAKKKTTYGDIASDVTEVSFGAKTTTDGSDATLRLDPDNVDPSLRYYAQTETDRLAQLGTLFQALDADTLKADLGDTLTAGFLSDSYSGGTVATGTYTPAPATGQENFQHIVNGGAFTLAPPASPCSVVLEITNNASAGVITTSGYTQVDGDSFTTTNGHDFMCFITKTANFSYLSVKALQ